MDQGYLSISLEMAGTTWETEGRKSRPVWLLIAIARANTTHLIFLAISGTPPRADQTTILIPALERRRAGEKLEGSLHYRVVV
jgi:hypothetical protein